MYVLRRGGGACITSRTPDTMHAPPSNLCLIRAERNYAHLIDSGLDLSGRGSARAEDAQETPTKSHISPSILDIRRLQRGELTLPQSLSAHQFGETGNFPPPKLTDAYHSPSIST